MATRTWPSCGQKNTLPDPQPPQDPAGTPSSGVYQNVKVLGKVDSNEFLRDMASITEWVAPEQGCTYCHSQENLAWDTLYTKIVARRMFQMVEYINTNWQTHVWQDRCNLLHLPPWQRRCRHASGSMPHRRPPPKSAVWPK